MNHTPFLGQDSFHSPTLSPELWHACAGPLVTLPMIGSKVVYFPQGHLEQVSASVKSNAMPDSSGYPTLPPHIICRLIKTTLHADVETEHVYAQLMLHPLTQDESNDDDDMYYDQQPRPEPNAMFCKMLTASDTSTHGGFSIPRKHAEACLPPLDYNDDPPAQSLAARDLQGHQWRFRHIYRGFPKRHLLTTGWTSYVTKKKLMCGDFVLFVRTDNGELRIGCRRNQRNNAFRPSSMFTYGSIHLGVLASAAHALSTRTPFTVSYSPRTSPSPFVIPLKKFKSALRGPIGVPGLRFRMACETDEATARRFRGTVVTLNNADPRWPNSLWRALEVRWDEAVAGEREERVSIWEIEPHFTHQMVHPQDQLYLESNKRLRTDGAFFPSRFNPYSNGAATQDESNGTSSWQSNAIIIPQQNYLLGQCSAQAIAGTDATTIQPHVQTSSNAIAQANPYQTLNQEFSSSADPANETDPVQGISGGNLLSSIQLIRDVLSKSDPASRNFIMQQVSGLSSLEASEPFQGGRTQSDSQSIQPNTPSYGTDLINRPATSPGQHISTPLVQSEGGNQITGNYLTLGVGSEDPKQGGPLDLALRLSSAAGGGDIHGEAGKPNVRKLEGQLSLGGNKLRQQGLRNTQSGMALGLGTDSFQGQMQSNSQLHDQIQSQLQDRLQGQLQSRQLQQQLQIQLQSQLQGQIQSQQLQNQMRSQLQVQAQGGNQRSSGSVNLNLGLR